MSNVVELVLAKSSEKIVGYGQNYPQKPSDEVLRAEMLALREIRNDLVLEAHNAPEFAKIEARAAPLMAQHGAGMRADIKQELRPATINQINEMIFMLVDSRRDSKDLSATFAEMTLARVSSLQPSFGALHSAVKRLIDEPRAEFKAKMEIADILDTVKSEQDLLERSLVLIDLIPKLLTELRQKFEAEAQQRAQRRERQKANIRVQLSRPPSDDPLAPGPDLDRYDKTLVEEVRQELGFAT